MAVKLVREMRCPNCWGRFVPAESLWVSEHAELRGDPSLGPDEASRFLPSRFTPNGDAIDSRGSICRQLACPKCRLTFPRVMVETPPIFFSILGAPTSGKSYWLASMTWELRRLLPERFQMLFQDSDPFLNRMLTEDEESLFLNPEPDVPMPMQRLIIKTREDVEGRTHLVSQGRQIVRYNRPYVFNLDPTENHHKTDINRCICMYDCAGEYFLPGARQSAEQMTQHMAISRALFFVFDPTQDPRFRSWMGEAGISAKTQRVRQELIFQEAAKRIRQVAGLSMSGKHNCPLYVVLTKADNWISKVGLSLESEPFRRHRQGYWLFDLPKVRSYSDQLQELMQKYCPDLAASVREFSAKVRYVPVAALGIAPKFDPELQDWVIRTSEIAPRWVTVPMLDALAHEVPGIFPVVKET